MLARDVTIEDFDTADWTRVGHIVRGTGTGTQGSMAGSESSLGGVLVIADGVRVVKLLHTRRGRLDPASVPPGAPLTELARSAEAAWAVRLYPGALRLLSARFGLRLERGDEFEGQILKLLSVVRELEAEGAVEVWPSPLRTWPLPSARAMKLFWDAVCPVGKSMLFAALEGPDVATLVALHRGPHGFDRIVGPERIRREIGLRSGDFRQNYRGVARAVELTVGPLALGCFAEPRTWSRMVRDRTPGAWAAAAASRDIVFYPIAPALAIPLGIDVGRVAWSLARDLADRFIGTAKGHAKKDRFF